MFRIIKSEEYARLKSLENNEEHEQLKRLQQNIEATIVELQTKLASAKDHTQYAWMFSQHTLLIKLLRDSQCRQRPEWL